MTPRSQEAEERAAGATAEAEARKAEEERKAAALGATEAKAEEANAEAAKAAAAEDFKRRLQAALAPPKLAEDRQERAAGATAEAEEAEAHTAEAQAATAEAEARKAEEERKAAAQAARMAEYRAVWKGKLRRTNVRYQPHSTLRPGASRWGKGEVLLDPSAIGDADQRQWDQRLGDLYETLQGWSCARRVNLESYRHEHFIRDASRWNVQMLKLLTKQSVWKSTHATLVKDVPERFFSAVPNKMIQDMVNNHLGELREIDGSWNRHDGVVPLSRVFYNAQYAINDEQFREWSQHQPAVGGSDDLPQLPDHTQDDEGRYCTILAAADRHSFKVRSARVIALAELFWVFGIDYTARELYAYYVHARRLVLNRKHPQASIERREQVHAHYQTTGYWGCGAVKCGEYVR